MGSELSRVVVLVLACAAISMTISKAGIFRSVRVWVKSKSEFFGEMILCPYCVSHWLALAATLLYRPRLITSGWWLVDYFVTIMVIVCLAALVAGLIFRAFMGYKPPEDDE